MTTTTQCTIGASACAFDNGIDFNALRSAIRTEFNREVYGEPGGPGGDPVEVDCDRPNQTPPNRVPVGQRFTCTVDQGGISGTVVVTVTSEAPYYRFGKPNIVLDE